MTGRELLVEAEGGEVRIASVIDGDVVDLIIERKTGGTIVGDVFLGRVQRVIQGIGAAFIAGLLQRHAWIAYLGLAVIGYVSVSMIWRGSLEVAQVAGL